LSQAYSFCFGSDEIIHQVSSDGQTAAAAETNKISLKVITSSINAEHDAAGIEVDPFIAYLDGVEDRAAERNHILQQTQQKSSKLGTVCATPIVAGFSSSL